MACSTIWQDWIKKIGVDRFSLKQAMIFICATNSPDELDLEFVLSGCIGRRLYIGLPDARRKATSANIWCA